MRKAITSFNSARLPPYFFTLIGLFCITLIAFAVRMYNLPQRGIIARDEAWYTYSAQSLESIFRVWVAQKAGISPDINYKMLDFERISSSNIEGKPTYLAALWLLGKIHNSWGYGNTLGLSVVAGLVNIPAIYILARKTQLSRSIALLAALSAAFSFTSVYFSRIGYPHALLITVYTFALCLYLHTDYRKSVCWCLFVVGVVLGIGLSIHMSLILAIPGLFVTEIYQYRKQPRENVDIFFHRGFLLGGGILFVLLGWELAYNFIHYILGSGAGITFFSGSFIGDLIGHAESAGSNSNPVKNFIFYGFALLGLENPLSSLFFGVGMISIWRKKWAGGNGKILSILFVMHLFSLLIYPAQYGRQIAPLLSIWPIFVAVGIASFIEAMKNRFIIFDKHRITGVVLIILICICNFYWMYPILSAGSTGWVKAAVWLKLNTTAEECVCTSEISDAAILNYYLPGRVRLWQSKTDTIFTQDCWYVNNPTTRFSAEWQKIDMVISEKKPIAMQSDPWLILRPHSVMGGNWLLIPWWRWSMAPKSYITGVDDVMLIYKIP